MKFLYPNKNLVFSLFVLILLLSIKIDIYAQNFQPAGINQISFIEPRQQPYSTYFILNGNIQGLNTPRFLNVFAKLPENPDVYDWVIQNVPLVPFPQPELMSFWFNLTYLGLENGIQVNQLLMAYFVTDTFLIMPPQPFPPSLFVPMTVNQAEYNVGNGYIREPYNIGFFDKEPLIFDQINVQEMLENLPNLLQYRGCRVPNIDLDSSANPPGSVAGYAGDKNACAPAAAANSMQWLETVHPEIKSNLSLREKLIELSKMMNRANNDGVSTVDFIKGKLDFIDKYKLPIKVKFQAQDTDTNNIKSPNNKYKNEASNRNANKSEPTKWAATWEFLFQEIKDGEDVELLLDSYTVDEEGQIVHTGGHVVTVSGVSQIGGVKRVWVKDDTKQGTSGGTEQTPLTWLLVSERTGIPYLKEWSEGPDVTIVTGIVSESFDPTIQHTFDPKATTIGRISFEEPFIATNTTSGLMGFYLFESNQLKYINALARTSETQQPVWLVQNMPVMPFHKDHWVSTPVELGALNLTAGVPIQVQFITSDTNLREKPRWNNDSFFDIFYKDELTHYIPDGAAEIPSFIEISNMLPPVFTGTQTPKDSVYRGCTVPNIDLNNESYPQSANWAGDLNACGPASAANSMHWLSETHPKITQDLPLREKMEELSSMMKRQNSRGVNTYQLIKGKLDFIDKYKLPIKVKFQSKWFKKDSNVTSPNDKYKHFAENKNNSNYAYPEWDWLVQEMKNGEDVELLYGYYDGDGNRRGGHWVTVTGVIESGGEKRIWIKDDILQSGEGYGKTYDMRDSTGEEVIGWGTNLAGTPVLRRFGFGDWQLRVESLVSESYDENVSFEPPKTNLKITLLEPGTDPFDFNPFGAYISDIYPKNDNLFYRNILLRNPENDSVDWVVRNMPIMPFENPRRISIGINLKKLFVNDRLPDSLDYFIYDFLDSTYPKFPEIDWKRINIQKSKYEVSIGITDPDTAKIHIPFSYDSIYHPLIKITERLKDSVYIGCNMPNVDLDSTANPATDTYAGDKNACGPAAAANSLHWLDKVHKLNTNKTLREKLEELSKYMERQKEKGVTNDQMIKGKLKFIAENKLPIEVKFQSFRHKKDSIVSIKDKDGKEIQAKNKNTKDNGYPTWDWLVQEMKDGEDVELIYGRYDSTGKRLGGHVVTVTGVLDDKGVKRIWFKDDTRQTSSGLRNNPDDSLETGEEVATWETIPGDIPVITRWGSKSRRIEAIISESYVEPVSPPKPIINDIKLERIKFDDGSAKKLDFLLLTYNFTSTDKTNYMNIIQKTNDENYDCWWWGKNIIIPKGISGGVNAALITNTCAIRKAGKTADIPNESEEYEVSIIFSDSILTVLPQKDSVYKLTLTERTISSFNDLTDNVLGYGFKPDFIPTYFIPSNPELNYNVAGFINIDLDSTISPTVDPSYAGDYNAGNPAAASISFEWLKRNYTQINDNTNARTKIELLSKFMNRQKSKGSTAVDMIKGKLALIDSLRLPVSVKFQLVDYGNDSIVSPNRTFGHFAKNNNVMAGYPTWEFINSEIKNGRTVEIMMQWIDKEGRLLGSKSAVVGGTSNANGLNTIWLLEDLDHSKSGGTILAQSIFMETATAISRSYLFDRSLGDTVCWVVGAVSQGYDPNMTFLDVHSELTQADFNISISRNPVNLNESADLILNAPEDGKISIKLYSIKGEEIAELMNDWVTLGRHEINLAGKLNKNLASGMYYIATILNGRTIALPIIILN
ncbi:MAG: hypothetical protein N2319_06970 [Candidatus Kapabacteria bacterium]|nr:hypothetical protein [Candidatus Kapabacteria bacterium]